MDELKRLYSEFNQMVEEDPELFMLLAPISLAIGAVVMNVRTCSQLDCPCQPEKNLKRLVEARNEVLIQTLYPDQYNLLQRYAVMA